LFETNASLPTCNYPHSRPIHTTTCLRIKQKKERHNSPWVVEKREAKEAKNVKIQAQLQQSREQSKLDPVVGRATPWTRSLHNQPPPLASVDTIIAGADDAIKSQPQSKIISLVAQQEDVGQLNFNLTPKTIEFALSQSHILTRPYQRPQDEMDEHQEEHDRGVAAMHRILSIGNGAEPDRAYARKQMCIEQFGRHNTDKTLPPIQRVTQKGGIVIKVPETRAGPDTGSSEVQIALFTAKIQHLHRHLTTNKNDKANKRNLRELVHKRQKLLKYLKRKERGGPRYQNIMASIGLDDAAVTDELFL